MVFRYKILLFLWCICAILISSKLDAQESLKYSEAYPHFREALDLYEKEKYGPAQQQFAKAIEAIDDVYSEIRIDAEYFHALSAVQLFHANAAALLKDFIQNHPESAKITSAYFHLGNFKFRKRKYSETIGAFAQIDPLDLNNEERDEYYFKLGYSYFQEEMNDQAANNFYQLIDSDNIYAPAARYYYAHISYQNKNYETAAVNFRKLEGNPQFGPIVPYYLTQIYYLQGKYDELLGYAPAVLDSAPAEREEEISRLIGDSYYKKKNYEEAIPYLLDAYESYTRAPISYKYQLGYAYFKTGNCEEAVNWFQEAISVNDTISQAAYYHIGECNIKLNDKRAARTAFRNAYEIGLDEEITEDALFNYAKTAYELSYHPYDDAILAFEEYINTYPSSRRINDANEYLVGVYYTTKNYKEALRSLERIKNRGYKLEEARQRLVYFRGVELFNQGEYSEAAAMFQLSREINLNPSITSPSIFWLAESNYRMGDYKNAISIYGQFFASPRAISLPYYDRAYYNTAYSYYEMKDYPSAIFWFREYINKNASVKSVLMNDAYLRLADSYFITRKYEEASKFYTKAAEAGMLDTDYANYQNAIAKGVLGKNWEKADLLLKVAEQKKENQIYRDDAIFELGKTYLLLGRSEKALEYYRKLMTEYPNSSYMAEANIKTGLIYYNQKMDDQALQAFGTVVKNYPNSAFSAEAMEKIRSIYIDKGDAEGFENYIANIPNAGISKTKMDSTSYVIAENFYLEGNCDKATENFTKYLNKYPNGIFAINAHFYRAECENSNRFYEEAIKDYKHVVEQSYSQFTENALVQLSALYKKQGYDSLAIEYYNQVLVSANRKSNITDAQKSLMELNFKVGNYSEAIKFAEKVLTQNKLSEKEGQNAKKTIAKSHLKMEDLQKAMPYLKELKGYNTEIGAEAKFRLAHIYYLQGKYEASDSLIYAIVEQVPSHPYWIAKGFILLADNFLARGDHYNAKVTFQSVINNAEDEELVQIANEKLEIVLRAEEEERNKNEEKPLEIDLNSGSGDPGQVGKDSVETIKGGGEQ